MKKLKIFTMGFIILAALGFILQSLGLAPKTELIETPTVTSQSSVAEINEETSETIEASSEDDNKLPKITPEQMASFIDYLKQDLTDKGVDISSYTFYNRDTILYVKVPNEYATYNQADLQAFADGLKKKEHEAFNVWAAINGVDFNSYPMLHIKTDNGDSLVSQTMTGDMKVRVK